MITTQTVLCAMIHWQLKTLSDWSAMVRSSSYFLLNANVYWPQLMWWKIAVPICNPVMRHVLPCPDVFHWHCLNNLASRLPLHTAPAGYQCPVCQGPVFPPPNLASPVADQLREQLSSVNWARAGLGLPLVRKCWIKCFFYYGWQNNLMKSGIYLAS